MMQDIKDVNGNIIGYMNVLDGEIDVFLNGKGKIGFINTLYPEVHKAYNSDSLKMAKWYKYDDCTYDAYNRKIGKGDMLLEVLIQSV